MLITLLAASTIALTGLEPQKQGATQNVRSSDAWTRRPIPNCFMSALLPTAPSAFNQDVPDPSGRVKRAVWAVARLGQTQIIFIYSAYKPGVNVELDTAIASGLDLLKSMKTVTDFKSQRRRVTISGLPGYRVRADYRMDGERTSYWMLIAGKGNRMWQVTCVAPSSPSEEAAVQRVMDSVQIKA